MDFLATNDSIAILLQLSLALMLGGLIGVERNLAHKTAGMRTYALVSMGSALFVIISQIVDASYIGIVQFDPMRVAAAIVTAVGFLGAGLIIFKDDKVSGLTTAAGLWVACGIGIAVGFHLYSIATIATLLTLFVFSILWRFEQDLKIKYQEKPQQGDNK